MIHLHRLHMEITTHRSSGPVYWHKILALPSAVEELFECPAPAGLQGKVHPQKKSQKKRREQRRRIRR